MIRPLAVLCIVAMSPAFGGAQPTAPRVRITEDLRLDAAKEDFSTIGRLYVGPHKQIVVTLPQDRQLRWYDSAGKPIGVIGRSGQGPGEFQFLGSAGWIGDTLWIFDSPARRTTFIGPDARLLRVVALPSQMTFAQRTGDVTVQLFGAGPLAMFPDGSAIIGGFTMINGPDGRQRASDMLLARMNASGAALHFHSPPSYNDPRWSLDVAGFQNYVPFRMPPQIAASTDGTRLAIMTADVAGTEGTFTVVLLRTSGEIVFSRTYPFKGVPIPQRAVDSALAAFIRPSTEGPSDLGQRFATAARPKMPAVHTPVTSILPGLDNTIWISLRPSTNGREVLVLDGRGNPIGSVLLPPRTTLRQANLTTIWATQTDDDGLASVVRYRLSNISCQECR
jgi:hypothetical protein